MLLAFFENDSTQTPPMLTNADWLDTVATDDFLKRTYELCTTQGSFINDGRMSPFCIHDNAYKVIAKELSILYFNIIANQLKLRLPALNATLNSRPDTYTWRLLNLLNPLPDLYESVDRESEHLYYPMGKLVRPSGSIDIHRESVYKEGQKLFPMAELNKYNGVCLDYDCFVKGIDVLIDLHKKQDTQTLSAFFTSLEQEIKLSKTKDDSGWWYYQINQLEWMLKKFQI